MIDHHPQYQYQYHHHHHQRGCSAVKKNEIENLTKIHHLGILMSICCQKYINMKKEAKNNQTQHWMNPMNHKLASYIYLIGGKMSGEVTNVLRGWRKFSPMKNFPTFYHSTKSCNRFFYPWPKLLSKVLYSNQKWNPDFYTLNYKN